MKVFWLWQSDTPGKIGRHFIREALSAAIADLTVEAEVEEPEGRDPRSALHLDQDRQGVPGSPDLARIILNKICGYSVRCRRNLRGDSGERSGKCTGEETH